MDASEISPAPWHRSGWTGEMISCDGTAVTDFERGDIRRVVEYGSTEPDAWDGDTAGIIELRDGRFVAWEAWWGPTGDGFCLDAYGGTSDLLFAATPEAARMHLSEKARDLLRPVAEPSAAAPPLAHRMSLTA